jgi:hypothetical protein
MTGSAAQMIIRPLYFPMCKMTIVVIDGTLPSPKSLASSLHLTTTAACDDDDDQSQVLRSQLSKVGTMYLSDSMSKWARDVEEHCRRAWLWLRHDILSLSLLVGRYCILLFLY